MRITIDTTQSQLLVTEKTGERRLDLYGVEAFEIISRLWLKTSWNQKYPYTFTWHGRPIIQHPEDLVRLQEVIYNLKPDVIVETGIAHGGSLIFYASLFRAGGFGRRVIGVDIEVRPHNRRAIEAHPLFGHITLIEGNSVDPDIGGRVRSAIQPGERVLVLLDSDHSYKHVSAELEAYCNLVTPGSYIVATDGIMRDVADVPRGRQEWVTDNPANAAEDFARRHTEFVIEEPAWTFNESLLRRSITAWPSAWLKRVG